MCGRVSAHCRSRLPATTMMNDEVHNDNNDESDEVDDAILVKKVVMAMSMPAP